MPLSSDEIYRRTDGIYMSISDQFNPNLKAFVTAGKAYGRALQGVSQASRHYFDAMNRLGMFACDNTSTKELGESIRLMSETLRQIQLHNDETVKFLNQDILGPLENRLENDQKYIVGVHRKYQSEFKFRVEDLERATSSHKKTKRKSYTGKKSYKYDEKEKQLAEAVTLKQRALDQFQHDNLRDGFIEERRRYCFFLEQQCELARKRITHHQKAVESLSSHLQTWIESCADIRNLPENATGLLEQVKSEDTNSVYSIPEPPSEPAMQMNGYDYNLSYARAAVTPTLDRRSPDPDPATRPTNSTGHNIIPRESRKKVTAIFSHDVPGNPTQLSFDKGDIIILMIPQPRDGWHYGENGRTKKRGWFPYSYTKLLEQYNLPDRPPEPIHGHMPLPPADYNSTPALQNGNGSAYPAPQEPGPDPYKQMKDDFLLGNPFANVQLRRTNNGDQGSTDSFSSFRS